MTSSPPHADKPAITDFLNQDEAASLTEALLDFVDAGQKIKAPDRGADEVSNTREIDKPPVLADGFPGPNNPKGFESSASIESDFGLGEAIELTQESEIDLAHLELRSAIATSDVLSNRAEVEENTKDSCEEWFVFFDRPKVDIEPNTTSDPISVTSNGGRIVVDPDPKAGNIENPLSERWDRVSSVTKAFLKTRFAVWNEAEDADVPTEESGRSKNVQQKDRSELATVAGSGFSQGKTSETIAGSGSPSAQSRLWDQFEESRDGDPGPGLGAFLEEVRPKVSPSLVSSDLPCIQTLRTKVVNDAQSVEVGQSATRKDWGASIANVFELYKRDKIAAAMAVIIVVSIGVVGWVAFSYIDNLPDASANLQRSLLIGPVALRSLGAAQRTSLSARSCTDDIVNSSPVLPSQKLDRLTTSAEFKIAPLKASNTYVVDLPRLEPTKVRRRVSGITSAINVKRSALRPNHRNSTVRKRPSVVNQRNPACTSTATK